MHFFFYKSTEFVLLQYSFFILSIDGDLQVRRLSDRLYLYTDQPQCEKPVTGFNAVAETSDTIPGRRRDAVARDPELTMV